VELTGIEQNILSIICNRDQEEPIAKAARELRGSANGAIHSLEWSNIDSLLQFREKIYIPQSPNLCRQIIVLFHDTQITGHPRYWKTLELVFQNYWWPQMSRYISQYISTCNLCLQRKPWQYSPVGELQLLSVLDAQWDTLSVNFMVKLPESSEHNTIITVMDSISKRVHFVSMLSQTCKAGAK